MAGMSTYLKNALVNSTLKNTPYTSPVNVYVALYTSDPTVSDTGAEVSGGGYARQPITFIAPVLGVTSDGVSTTFPVSTVAWGTIAYFGIKDSVTAGNLLYFGALTTPRTLASGDTITIPVSNISITLS